MIIKNINQVLTPDGNTSDIIHAVMYAYDIENDPQIKELAFELKAETVEQTCNNIFDYLINNIHYRADSDTGKGEMVRSPARLIYEGSGDCKSYSLLTAVVLRWLGIPHFFRFVSYNKEKQATHVYVVAQNNIVIDAVAGSQLHYPFGKEVPYTYRCDMYNSMTKISYLAGFKPGTSIGQTRRIGSTDTDDIYRVDTSGEHESDITPGKSYLYSEYDLTLEHIYAAKSDGEISDLYNQLAVWSCLLWAYDFVNGDTSELDQMCVIIAAMSANGDFAGDGTDITARETWFETLKGKIQGYFQNENYPDKINAEFYQSLLDNVVHQNEKIEFKADNISGISGWNPLGDALKKAGIYFLYIFIPESDLSKYPSSVAKKKKIQKTFFDLINAVDIFHNAATIKNYFSAGILARTGYAPLDYLAEIKKTNIKGVAGVGVLLETIATVISIVIGLLEIIKVLFPNSSAANYAVSAGAADVSSEVYSTKSTGSSSLTTTLTSTTGLIGIGLGLTVLWTLFKKRKSNG